MLLGWERQDLMIGGVGDDGLRGGEALDIYDFERPGWGQDAIRDASPGNLVRLPDGDDFGGAITTNLNSDAGPLPEVANAEGGSTVDWKGVVVAVVVGSTGDDTVTGSDATNLIFDDEAPGTDHGHRPRTPTTDADHGRRPRTPTTDADHDTIPAAGESDLIDVPDAADDDKVACGDGHDTVYFDQELEMVAPAGCEEQNPIPNSAQRERRDATFGVGSPEEAPAGVWEDE